MKRILLLLVFLCSAAVMQAQTFGKGTGIVGVSAGFISSYGIPIAASYEHGIYDINENMAIGVGGTIGWGLDTDDYGSYKYVYNNVLFAAKSNFHYLYGDNWDFYAGLLLGYNYATAKVSGDYAYDISASTGGVVYGLAAGARYAFTERLGAFAEIGFGLSVINIGVAFKL